MPDKPNLVLSRFWARTFEEGYKPAVLVPNEKRQPEVIVTPGGTMVPHAVVLTPKPYVPIIWRNAATAVAAIMAYLRAIGFKPGDRAAILAWNCPEWVWADLAIQSMGGITVPIYPHSTAEQVNYVLQDSRSVVIFSNEQAQLDKVDTASGVTTALFDHIPAALGAGDKTAGKPFSRLFVGWGEDGLGEIEPADWSAVRAELASIRREFNSACGNRFLGVSADHTATIIYTSGSTGVPKGAVLTHGNIASACQALIDHGFSFGKNELYLSYLPLAHVYERVDGAMLCLWAGVPMSFCRVEEVGDTLKVLRPTILLGVPAVWRKMRDKIQNKIDQETGLKAGLIRWAFQQKKPGIKRFFADLIVFRKIRAQLGGKLWMLMSGGAPISPDILEFFDTIGLNLLQGYGLTETAGGLSVNIPGDLPSGKPGNKLGSVGRVIDGVEVRLVQEDGQEGDGEIWVRGKTVFAGYWNLPEETSKAVTGDGWFKTGDLGRQDEDGFLYITGRKKRLLKTDGGKYVAPEKIEKAFEGEPIVHYIVPVGDGKPFISGLIFLNVSEARDRLTRASPAAAGLDVASLAGHPEICRAVEEAVRSANSKLERWEQLKKFRIVPVEATVAGGLLTPTLKIRTEEVLKRHADLIDEFYTR